MGSAIEVRDLQVDRGGRRVLKGIDLDVAGGSVTGLLGPSGCGKTTLMRSIVGVQVTHGGSVQVLGEPAGSPPLRSRVGYVTQDPAVYRDLSVDENLRYFAALTRAPGTRIEETLAAVELTDARRQVVRSLSGGQQARISLATALVGDPDVLVLDEPTVGLDPVLRRDLWSLFRTLAAERNVTLLVSSHVMEEAAECDDLILMREGAVLALETPDGLRNRTGEADLGRAFLKLIETGAG